MNAGYSAIPSMAFLHELEDDERRNGFVADHVRTRLALLIRNLREQNEWSQAELGRRLGKPQSVISRLEDPDYGRLSLQTLFEVAAVFGLPLYIDMPNWDEWFRLMDDMSSRNLNRRRFNVNYLSALANPSQLAAAPTPADPDGMQTAAVSISQQRSSGAVFTFSHLPSNKPTPEISFDQSKDAPSVIIPKPQHPFTPDVGRHRLQRQNTTQWDLVPA